MSLQPPSSLLSWLLKLLKTSFQFGTLAPAGGHSKLKVPLTTGRRSKNSSGQLLRLRTAWDKSQFVTKRNKVKWLRTKRFARGQRKLWR